MNNLFETAARYLRDDPYANTQGIELIDIGEKTATLEMTITRDQRSFLGGAHGGCLFALADTAFGLTANCAGNISVGIDTHMAFIRGCRVGDRISAHAQELFRSKRTAIYRVDLSRAQELVATFTGTVFITGKSPE